MPADFDDLTEYDSYQEPVFFYAGPRRWFMATLQLTSGKWRKVHFLVDTGATRSYMLKRFRTGLREIPRSIQQYCVLSETRVIDVLHSEVTILDSETASNSTIQTINIVGANFINNFVLFDDYRSRTFFLLPRSPQSVAKEETHRLAL